MEQPPTPPVLQNPAPRRKRNRKIVLVATFLWGVVFFGIPLVILFKFAIWFASTCVLEISNKSPDDRFSLQILAVKSRPNYFEERIRVRCPNDMNAGIWVTDLKKAGFFETKGRNGEAYYREGRPRGIGSSTPVHVNGKFSTCEILFRITTSSENTKWHSEIANGNLDTTISNPLTVSEVQTNWPGTYQRDSDIPLANLGDYIIMLSIK